MTEGSILPYLSTASVVRDMVEMLDQVHALRNRNSSHPHVAPAASHRIDEKVIELKRGESADVPRIQYWGFSCEYHKIGHSLHPCNFVDCRSPAVIHANLSAMEQMGRC